MDRDKTHRDRDGTHGDHEERLTDESDARDMASLKRALGQTLLDALSDPQTKDVSLNDDGRVWQERIGERMRCIGKIDPTTAMNIVRRIAGSVRKEITRSQPLLECDLPLDGSRVAAQIPPVVPVPTLSIRKHASEIFTITQYVDTRVMTPKQADALLRAISDHDNILVLGGTGSGKTTLVNALISAMVDNDPLERIVVIEDSRELQCAAQNVVRFCATKQVSIRELLRATMRMRPDRILVGEVRGPEALSLLMALNSGHPGGCATLHANSSRAGLSKLAMMVSMDPESPEPIEPLIAEALPVLVHIEKAAAGWKLREILKVDGYDDRKYQTTRLDSP